MWSLPMRELAAQFRHEHEDAEIESLFQVNFFGVLYTADAVIGKMVERGSGRFAAVSSLAGWRGLPFSGSYSASKAAVTAWMESSRVQLQRTGRTHHRSSWIRTHPNDGKEPFPDALPDECRSGVKNHLSRHSRWPE